MYILLLLSVLGAEPRGVKLYNDLEVCLHAASSRALYTGFSYQCAFLYGIAV